MEKLHLALVAAGLLSAVPTDDVAAAKEFGEKWEAVNTKIGTLDTATKAGETLKARAESAEKELNTVRNAAAKAEADLIVAKSSGNTELDAVKAKLIVLEERHAETVVVKAVESGLIAPKDEEGKKRMKALIMKDPTNEDLIDSMIENRAGTTVDPTKRIITAKAGTKTITANQPADAFVETVKAKYAVLKSKTAALQAAIAEKPDQYAAYNECDPRPEIKL